MLVRYLFSDVSGTKVRPAVVVSAPHTSQDVFVVPLTSRKASLLPGEFLLADWSRAGLNVPTALKRGVYTVHQDLVVKIVGRLSQRDADQLQYSLQEWLGFLGRRSFKGHRLMGCPVCASAHTHILTEPSQFECTSTA